MGEQEIINKLKNSNSKFSLNEVKHYLNEIALATGKSFDDVAKTVLLSSLFKEKTTQLENK